MDWLRAQFIEKLGGYPDLDSAIEAIRAKGHKEKYQILTLAVQRLFNTIGADDILRVDQETGEWMLKGKPMNDGDKNLLKAEAAQFLQSRLWNVLKADIEYQSNRQMFLLAKSEEELTAGKLWILTLDAFKTRLKSLSAGSGLFNSQK